MQRLQTRGSNVKYIYPGTWTFVHCYSKATTLLSQLPRCIWTSSVPSSFPTKNQRQKLSKEVKGHLRFLCLPCFESGMHKLLYDKVHTKMCLSPVAVSGRSCGLAALPHTSVTLNFRGRLPKTVNVVLNSETVPKPS